MAPPLPPSADSQNKFEDLSGVNIAAFANPYDALIEACKNDPAQLQARYAIHRTTRNGQQKAKLLSSEFSGLILDPILQRLADPAIEPGFIDPRNCLVFWARPPAHIRALVDQVQQKLVASAPTSEILLACCDLTPDPATKNLVELWLMPLLNLHLTALEITFSLTEREIKAIVSKIGPETIAEMTDYTYSHRARLIKPMLSYDGAALALSFLPAAGEGLFSTPLTTSSQGRTKDSDMFTYHHLRRDLFNIAKKTGVSIDSRYVVPSSHITVGRFLTQEDHEGEGKMAAWIEKIEEINEWLEDKYWPKEGGQVREDAQWIVGQERGLDCRAGALWYGGGSTVRIGKGF